jgi:hypothetical protein
MHWYHPSSFDQEISMDCSKYRLFCFLAYRIQDMRRGGILERIDNNYWPPKLQEILHDPPKSVTLETALMYFVLLGAGILISAALLMVEIRCRK